MLLTVEQAERIEALRRQWGLGSTASVVRRLVDRGLEVEDKVEAVA